MLFRSLWELGEIFLRELALVNYGCGTRKFGSEKKFAPRRLLQSFQKRMARFGSGREVTDCIASQMETRLTSTKQPGSKASSCELFTSIRSERFGLEPLLGCRGCAMAKL